ncbi:MAG: hypothetical protein Kow0074_25190 [Candidatus Zixiibacteriota bacterium]
MGCGSCDGNGNGNGPSNPGAVRGVVQLPFKLSAFGEPVEGADVHLVAGDLDTTTTTDANGEFLFGEVPSGNARVDVTFGSCLSVTRVDITVTEDDTTDLILELRSHTDIDSVTIGWSNATRMEVSPDGNRIVLLYNAAARGGTPGLATVDLATKTVTTRELAGITDVFDLKFVRSDLAVFNYREGEFYRVQFFDPVTLNQSGDDVQYHNSSGIQHDGRLVPLPNGLDVFVTHGTRELANPGTVIGWVYCVSVTQRNLNDADDDIFNGEFAFNNGLVAGALKWPYNISYDAARGEILVGNRDSTIVTAIDLSHWGSFDRAAGLSMPATGVRHIQMSPPQVYIDQGYSVLEWAFKDGSGVAMRTTGGDRVPILRYTSGNPASDLFIIDSVSFPASNNHLVKIVPERNSWLSIFRDPNRSFNGNVIAVEERSMSTLKRVYRYESQYLDVLQPTPTAYDVDPLAGVIYIAYKERDWIEVYCLPEE